MIIGAVIAEFLNVASNLQRQNHAIATRSLQSSSQFARAHARVCADRSTRNIADQGPEQHVALPQVSAVSRPQRKSKAPENIVDGGCVVGGSKQQGLVEREGCKTST